MKKTMVRLSALSSLLLQVVTIISGQVLERSYQQIVRDQWVTEIVSESTTSALTAPKSAKEKENAFAMVSKWVAGQPSDAKRSGSTEQTNFGIRLDRQGELARDGVRFTNFQVQVGGSSLAQCNSQKGLVGFDKASEFRGIQKCLVHSLNRKSRVWITQKRTSSDPLHKRGWFVPKTG